MKEAGLEEELQKKVSDWILQTQHHMQCDVKASHQDKLLFLDMDLSILGMQDHVYKKYAVAIRKEYAHFEDEAYRTGRAKVLQSFLEKDKLYFTKILGEKLEARARENINNEIKSLQKA